MLKYERRLYQHPTYPIDKQVALVGPEWYNRVSANPIDKQLSWSMLTCHTHTDGPQKVRVISFSLFIR